MLLFGICLITLGSVALELREKLQLDSLGAGALFSILPLGILAGSLLFGPIADKYGYRLLLTVSALLVAGGLEGIAFSPDSGWMKLFIFFFGLGGGTLNGATNALVADISETDKGAKLSLLGVFFGVGALGMPVIAGLLEGIVNFESLLASVGIIALLVGTSFLLITFPPPKQSGGVPFSRAISLLKDPVLLLIAFFLFFQSGFEAIINNWTTTFLIENHNFKSDQALFALSSFVAGMTLMRLATGSIFKNLSAQSLLICSFSMIPAGLTLMLAGNALVVSVTGLILLGAGLASGFPVMLGLAGARFAELSGTAFSLILFIALMGNTLINLAMGYVARFFGITHLITFAFAESVLMSALCIIILRTFKKLGN